MENRTPARREVAMLWGACACACVCVLATAGAQSKVARAHDPGLSSMLLTQHAARGAFVLVVDNAALPEARRAGARGCDASGVLALALDGEALAVDARCEARDSGHTAYEGTFALPRAGQLAVTLPLLAELPRGRRSFVRGVDDDGRVLAQAMLERGDRMDVALSVPTVPRLGPLLLVGLLAAVLALPLLHRRLRGHA